MPTVISDTSGIGIASINPFRYRSYYYDTETELYYLQSRYYDPVVGRFINGDDIQAILSEGLGCVGYNVFTYCQNSPVNGSDIDGQAFIQVFAKIILGILLGVYSQLVVDILNYLVNLISNSNAVFSISAKDYMQIYVVALHLRNASIHDQNIFNAAMAEMLSPIENPRYVLISKNIFKHYNYELSFACPSIIGKKKEYVEVLAEKLKATIGNFEPVYTHREDGRRLILKCRKRSYITFNEKAMGKKYKVSHWD